MTSWSHEDLAGIAASNEIRIAPLRQDGERFAAPPAGRGFDGDDVLALLDGNQGPLVLGMAGLPARFLATLVSLRLQRRRCPLLPMAQRRGRIQPGDTVFDVAFEEVNRSVDDVVDAAYEAKYRRSPYLAPMLAPGARAATVRVSPFGAEA